jgi:hypothetical protein
MAAHLAFPGSASGPHDGHGGRGNKMTLITLALAASSAEVCLAGLALPIASEFRGWNLAKLPSPGRGLSLQPEI